MRFLQEPSLLVSEGGVVRPEPPLCPLLPQQVRETETWMPMKSTAAIGMSTHRDDLEASGDSEDGADFSFTDDEDYDSYGFSGSGDEGWS